MRNAAVSSVGWTGICLAQGIGGGSDDPEAHFRRGVKQLGEGEYDQAIASFNQVIRLNPKHADAYHNRGVGKLKTAIGDFKQAIRLYSQEKLNSRFESLDSAQHELLEAGSMDVVIKKVGERNCELSVNGKRYGQVAIDAHVFIDPSERTFVNGAIQRPR